jgi:hypothetical protein
MPVITARGPADERGPLTAGLLVQHFSGRWAMAAFAIAIAAAALSSIILPGFRDTGPKPAPSPATQD